MPPDETESTRTIGAAPCFFKTVASPVGELRLVARDDKLVAILWKLEQPRRVVLGVLEERRDDPTLLSTEAQLAEYFAGRRRDFDLPLDPLGTWFQKRVWDALRRIPFGETRTYTALAAELGSPNAARAVGAANGRNPIAIVVPCHRLLGASGGLQGFAGGLEAKQALLSLESETYRNRPRRGSTVYVPASGYTPASWVSR